MAIPRGADNTRFEVTLDCPGNRYVNDGAICGGDARPRRREDQSPGRAALSSSPKVLASGRLQHHLLGWTPGSTRACCDWCAAATATARAVRAPISVAIAIARRRAP